MRDWSADKKFGYSGYRVGVGQNVRAIQKELYKRGSIQATFYIYSDFLSYKTGVYQHVAGEMLGGHAVKLIGWGEENGVPYWLIANSWNTDWVRNTKREHALYAKRRGEQSLTHFPRFSVRLRVPTG